MIKTWPCILLRAVLHRETDGEDPRGLSFWYESGNVRFRGDLRGHRVEKVHACRPMSTAKKKRGSVRFWTVLRPGEICFSLARPCYRLGRRFLMPNVPFSFNHMGMVCVCVLMTTQ